MWIRCAFNDLKCNGQLGSALHVMRHTVLQPCQHDSGLNGVGTSGAACFAALPVSLHVHRVLSCCLPCDHIKARTSLLSKFLGTRSETRSGAAQGLGGRGGPPRRRRPGAAGGRPEWLQEQHDQGEHPHGTPRAGACRGPRWSSAVWTGVAGLAGGLAARRLACQGCRSGVRAHGVV